MNYKHSKKTLLSVIGAALFTVSGMASAGPIIIGGDDLTDHGSSTGSGLSTVNSEGWLYIEKAIQNINASVTRSGPYNFDVAALGSSSGGGGAGDAIASATAALGLSVGFFDTDTSINQFFTDLAGGTVNTRILWIAGTGAGNDLDSNEGTALANNATAIDTFVGAGGGLMAHGSGSTAFGWLNTLLPSLAFPGGCTAGGATLTAAGQAAFPGLSNSNIDSNAGPCHNHFTGVSGGLTVLATDGQGEAYIIGANTGGSVTQPGPNPVPEPTTLALLGLGMAAIGAASRRKNKKALAG